MESYGKERDVRAMYYFGRCYSYGHGVPKNEEKTMEWFMKAAILNVHLQ